jgi:hypothetical protein
MNELINQLKQQAGIDYNPDQEGLDLFAELIVKECIKAYNDDGYQTEYEQDQKVLKHFGVEE